MKKTKRIILACIIGFILLVSFQILSSGHGHVLVISENADLNKKNQKLTKRVYKLKAVNAGLIEEKKDLQEIISEVSDDLDSTKSVVKEIKKELEHERDIIRKQSTGKQFDFQPISLPTSDGD